MDQFHNAEYTAQVMATAQALRTTLGEVEFGIGVNALIMVLAECGKRSDLSDKEFLTLLVVQAKHLMDIMTVTEHTIQ